jgi:hypothetical protein
MGRNLEYALVGIVAALFLIMGLYALIDPQATLEVFTSQKFNPDMRNEIRAVYGGFGVAVAGVLLATLWVPVFTFGARLTVAIALLGMAMGRIVSFSIEPAASNAPGLFLIVEITLAAMLLGSLKISTKG